MKLTEKWKQSARKLKQELHVIYLACKDPRTPWFAKALAACVVGYALSPMDLIPDPVPILGYIDDFLLLPLIIAAFRKMIPAAVLAECQLKITEASPQSKCRNWIAASVIIMMWISLAIFSVISIKVYFF